MNINELASRQKDLSRAIYVSLVAGGMSESSGVLSNIQEMRDVLDEIERIYNTYSTKSDLKSLAQREAQR